MKTAILSWNVNGVRSIEKKGGLKQLLEKTPDILCLQETKAHPSQLGESLLSPPGYFTCWTEPVRKGYSGVAIFSRKKPDAIRTGFGVPRFDEEGRVLLAEFPAFTLLNIYFPNGKASEERIRYKLDFYEETLRFVKALKSGGKRLVISGDYNTAHKPIDLARPKENENVSGFLPVERAWLDRWIEDGQIDIFRHFNKEPAQYSWWDMKTRARERNVGWRIDYHFITRDLLPFAKGASLCMEVPGSDHCPASLLLDI